MCYESVFEIRLVSYRLHRKFAATHIRQIMQVISVAASREHKQTTQDIVPKDPLAGRGQIARYTD